MAVLPQLVDPKTYRACDTDLLIGVAARAYWLDLFATHLDVQLAAARSLGAPQEAIDAARRQLLDELALLHEQPGRYGRLDILVLDELRRAALVGNGIVDEFRAIKQRETEAALLELPQWLARLDALDERPRLEAIVTGMLAGNLFDMGVPETAQHYVNGPLPFERALARVPRRPWLIDDLDAAISDCLAHPPRKAIVFADNAGADAVLGLLPLIRALLRMGSQVIATANSQPSLNDITHDALITLIDRAASIDSTFGSDQLRCVPSGNAAPLIDLTRISDELAQAAAGADLIVLVGMGRSIESNFSARFSCGCWRVAMIKDPQVARTVGGKLYDAVFRATWPSDNGGVAPRDDKRTQIKGKPAPA